MLKRIVFWSKVTFTTALVFIGLAVPLSGFSRTPEIIEKVRTEVEYKTPDEEPLGTIILEAARANDLPPEMIEAVIEVESGGNPNLINPNTHITAGMPTAKAMTWFDYGLMQVNGQTAMRYGVKDLTELVKSRRRNVEIGAKVLRQALDAAARKEKGKYKQRLLAFAAYHRGEGKMHDDKGLSYATRAMEIYLDRVLT